LSGTSSTTRTLRRSTTRHGVCGEGGIGYWRVITDYAHDGSFEQEIFLRRIKDAMTVYLDPDIESADGADAKFGFVFEDITKTEFEAQYPGEEAKDVNFPLDRTGNSWIDKDKIRIAEYFRKAAKRDTLVNHPMRGPMLLSDLPEGAEKEARGQPDVQKRDVVVPEITWYRSPATR
jgi:hypothetical protein